MGLKKVISDACIDNYSNLSTTDSYCSSLSSQESPCFSKNVRFVDEVDYAEPWPKPRAKRLDGWTVLQHTGRSVVTRRFDSRDAAESVFRRTWYSAIFFSPRGKLLDRKACFCDRHADHHIDILVQHYSYGDGDCPRIFTKQWSLGVHRFDKVAWEVFHDEAKAMRRFHCTLWSKSSTKEAWPSSACRLAARSRFPRRSSGC